MLAVAFRGCFRPRTVPYSALPHMSRQYKLRCISIVGPPKMVTADLSVALPETVQGTSVTRELDGPGWYHAKIAHPEHTQVLLDHVLEKEKTTGGILSKIQSIDIVDPESQEDPNFQKSDNYFKRSHVDPRLTTYCAPITSLLNYITLASHSLSSFTWTSPYDWPMKYGQRPPSFWTALWAHARTLSDLHIGFYEHELGRTAPPPPDVTFPALTNLRIDASTAHGDNGQLVEHIFKNSPNLERLDFVYPGCDLYTCQIQNITWDYDFPHLKRLEVRGWDFNRRTFAHFLTRCSNVEVFTDGVDYIHSTPEPEFQSKPQDPEAVLPPVPLPVTAFPNLRALCMNTFSRSETRNLYHWFDPQAARPIQHVMLGGSLSNMQAIANGKQLKVLEVRSTNIKDWRPTPGALSYAASELVTLLPKLPSLQELALGMDSGCLNYSYRNDDGSEEVVVVPPMNVDDLKHVISLLPPSTQIRALRLWDTQADALPQSLLDDFYAVPASLEYISWEGKEKRLYRLEKMEGTVRAVECEVPRQRRQNEWRTEDDDWLEDRILDY
ncbi:hypothetical protein M011DRAFT_505592 [Sporormia fimetaria CBS 119925]|uniref:F-box domain-containing protein n=1 Tax=Sporormia fimetaria CBS 119925 TaxID=1340428 RepID=A0A6A6V636_9PLEO|nr:hypothetical protein M011DRAFT_505592 [Sporormia fimetaria CBS 119925]